MKNNPFSSFLLSWYRKALRHAKYRWVVVFGTLFYLLSPIDISSDIFPVVGWIDDGIVVSLLVSEVSQMMLDALQRRRFSQTTKETETEKDSDDLETITVNAVPVS